MTQTKAELLQTRHQGDIRLGDADSTHYVGFKAPATVGTSLVWTLPATDGTAGYYLKTDGSGNLGWSLDNSGVTLSGSTNNTIATVTGANALQGEANLTFDGSELKLPTGSGTQGLFFQASSGSNANLRGVGTNYGELGFFIGNSEKFRLDSSGRLLVGTNAARTSVGATGAPGLQVEGLGASDAQISIVRNSDSAAGPYFAMAKTRGTSDGSNTIVQADDTLGTLYFTAADGADINQQSAFVRCQVDGTPGANDTPGRLTFATTPDGGVTPIERMRITSLGQIVQGTTTPRERVHFHYDSSDENYLRFTNSGTGTGTGDGFNVGISASEEALIWNKEGTSLKLAAGDSLAIEIDQFKAVTYEGSVWQKNQAVSALAINLGAGNYFTKTISGNSTFTFINPPPNTKVCAFTLELTHSSGTVTWPSEVKWNADTAPTLTTGKTHLFMFVTDDGGSRYRGSALVDYVN